MFALNTPASIDVLCQPIDQQDDGPTPQYSCHTCCQVGLRCQNYLRLCGRQPCRQASGTWFSGDIAHDASHSRRGTAGADTRRERRSKLADYLHACAGPHRIRCGRRQSGARSSDSVRLEWAIRRRSNCYDAENRDACQLDAIPHSSEYTSPSALVRDFTQLGGWATTIWKGRLSIDSGCGPKRSARWSGSCKGSIGRTIAQPYGLLR